MLRVLRSDFLTQGPEVLAFEREFARRVGARYAVAVSHGTAALNIACRAAGLGPGDEVITSPMTFVATASSIVSCGARPVFADIDPKTWNLDPGETEKKLTRKTRALIPVDYAGLPVDLDAFRRITRREGLVLIQDAAHSVGGRYRGRPVGSGWADMTVFSFHPVKNMTTGEGGMVVTQNRHFFERLQRLRNHGVVAQQGNRRPWFYRVVEYGNNYRLSDIHAALGRVQLRRLSGFIRKRRSLASRYRRRLSGNPALTFQVEPPDCRSAFHLCVVRVDPKPAGVTRNKVYRRMVRAGIVPQVHYIPVHLHPYYRSRYRTRTGQFPRAEEHYQKALSLPLYPRMSLKDVDRVCTRLEAAVR